VIIPLADLELAPGQGDIVIQVAASYRGVPNDYTVAVDDVFYGVGASPTATHPTVVGFELSAGSTSGGKGGGSPLPWIILGGGGLLALIGTVWYLRRDR
jgi:hypothetical protein